MGYRGIDRRHFLKIPLWGALWVSSGALGCLFPQLSHSRGHGPILADITPDIGVVKGGGIRQTTRAAVELLGGMRKFVKPGDRVVIKPNMSFTSPPERASNTHPEVIQALAAMCKEAGAAKIRILDNTLQDAEMCLERSGIPEACKAIDDKMVFAVKDDSLYRETAIPNPAVMPKADIMKEVLKADVLIAAPVAKSHSATGVSLSMKGMMGLIYNRRVMHSDYDLNKSIVDLCTVLKADLAVIDGTRVLSTNGPYGPGKVLHERTVITSTDMVAADALAVSAFEWYGRRFKPRQVPHIKEAHARGLGRMDIENLRVKTLTM